MTPALDDTTLHVPTLLLTGWACSIAYFDVRFRRIPNMLSLGAWVIATSILVAQRVSLLGAPASSALLGAGLALLLTLPGYMTRRLGAGDVKYLVAIALLTSFDTTLWCFIVAALAGGLAAVLWLNAHNAARLIPDRAKVWRTRLTQWSEATDMRSRMPFGPLLSLGLIVVLWVGPRS